MAFKLVLLEEFGKAFVPKKVIPNLRSYILKAGFDEVPYRFFGLLFYFSAFVTTIVYILFIFPFLQRYSLFQVWIYSFLGWFSVQLFFAALFIMLVYFYLDLRIYLRTRKMEDQLPDFLELLSANLKAGMTFERALWSWIKPRFGILGSEMAKTSKKVMTGYDLSKALMDLADKYDSLMLKRTVDLVVSEVESGGNVAELIDRLVDNLKETKELKDEMVASSVAYVIFISVIVVLISPLLFALSFYLLRVLINFIGQLSSATQNISSLPFAFGRFRGSPEEFMGNFRKFSLVALFVISFFSSLIVAIVEKGNIKAGLKYIPLFVFGSLGFYLIFMRILDVLFFSIA